MPKSTSPALSGNDALVLDGPGVPIDANAVDQLRRVAAHPCCVKAVGQADLHAGPGQPIGASFHCTSLWPRLVGGDAGCGVRLTIGAPKFRGDRLIRRVDEAFSKRAEWNQAVHEAAWFGGVRGLADVSCLPDALRALAAKEPCDELPPSGVPDRLDQLDSIGGGNHFAEVTRPYQRVDDATCDALGLDRRALGVLVHSGSRGVGKRLAYASAPGILAAEDVPNYLGRLAGAVRFAAANRFLLSWRLLAALGVKTRGPLKSIDLVHNTVVPFDGGFLHRKGCAPAEANDLTVVLGSRGSESWILRGLGKRDYLCSAPHGAGRRLTRSDARRRFSAAYKRRDLRAHANGVVLCERTELLYEEHPKAYKPIEAVIRAVESHGVGSRVASLMPLITVKR